MHATAQHTGTSGGARKEPRSGLWSVAAGLAACLLLFPACDSVQPEEDSVLVVEAFLDAEKPLPTIVLRRTLPLNVPYSSSSGPGVGDATIAMLLDGISIPYVPVPDKPGEYRPAGTELEHVPSRAAFQLQITWQEQLARAEGSIPPPIFIDSVRVTVPDEPIDAVLIDSLFLDPSRLDSLGFDSLGTGAQRGFIYPVEVELWWTTGFPEVGPDSAYWVRTHLKPLRESADAFNRFLRPEQVQRERSIQRRAEGKRSWVGVYAVPVDAKEDPMPEHRLRVSLLRSGRDYARYATSRDAPERREPVSNVEGGIGIVVGLSVDSLVIDVRQEVTTFRLAD